MCGPLPNVKHDARENPGDDPHRRSQEKSVWSDEGAPYPSEKFTFVQLLWFLLLASVATTSILALNARCLAASIFWIVYECYIVFDHAPFLFTNCVYKSPSFNYRYINPIFFWGMEAIACIIATQSLVKAPCILLYNAAPHLSFVGAHVNQTATSKAFSSSQMKTWWVCLQVTFDNIIHLACLWYHIKYISTGFSPLLPWSGAVSSMVLLTLWVHDDEMSWSHFLVIAGTESKQVDDANDSCKSGLSSPDTHTISEAAILHEASLAETRETGLDASVNFRRSLRRRKLDENATGRKPFVKKVVPKRVREAGLDESVTSRKSFKRRSASKAGFRRIPSSARDLASPLTSNASPSSQMREAGPDESVTSRTQLKRRSASLVPFKVGKPAFDVPSIPMPAAIELKTNRARMA